MQLISQLSPEYPNLHSQWYDATSSVHVALFWQGDEAQSSRSVTVTVMSQVGDERQDQPSPLPTLHACNTRHPHEISSRRGDSPATRSDPAGEGGGELRDHVQSGAY